MYKVKVNNKAFNVNEINGLLHLDGKPFEWDIIKIDDSAYHIIKDNQSYRAELVRIDHEGKSLTLKINGNKYDIKLQDKFDLLLERLGMNAAVSSKLTDIKAPMPGLIVEVHVKPGDEVQKGTRIMVLEAMKMENVIKAEGDGIVQQVTVKKGDSVEKNQLLVQF